jgi:YHS domain-containing protein
MKQIISSRIFLALIVLLLTAITINAQDKPKEKSKEECSSKACCSAEKVKTSEVKIWNKYCPVKGGEVDVETATVEYKGKNIGFCCPGCDDKFSKNPEKYLKNLSDDGQEFIKETKKS